MPMMVMTIRSSMSVKALLAFSHWLLVFWRMANGEWRMALEEGIDLSVARLTLSVNSCRIVSCECERMLD